MTAILIGFIFVVISFPSLAVVKKSNLENNINYQPCNNSFSSYSVFGRYHKSEGYIELTSDNKIVPKKNIEIIKSNDTDNGTKALTVRYVGQSRYRKFIIYKNDNGYISKITEIGYHLGETRKPNLYHHFYFSHENSQCQLQAVTSEVLAKNEIDLEFELEAEKKIDLIVKSYAKEINYCYENDETCSDAFNSIYQGFKRVKQELIERYSNDRNFMIFQLTEDELHSTYFESIDQFLEQYIQAYESFELIRNRFAHPYFTLLYKVYGKAGSNRVRIQDWY